MFRPRILQLPQPNEGSKLKCLHPRPRDDLSRADNAGSKMCCGPLARVAG